MGLRCFKNGERLWRKRTLCFPRNKRIESWNHVWKEKKDTIHHNGESFNVELLYRIIHSANQLCVYGAVTNWCETLERTESEKRENSGHELNRRLLKEQKSSWSFLFQMFGNNQSTYTDWTSLECAYVQTLWCSFNWGTDWVENYGRSYLLSFGMQRNWKICGRIAHLRRQSLQS